MGRKHTSAENLHRVLQQAYRQKTAEGDPADAQALMRRIHHLAAAEPASSPVALLDRLFWQLVPAAGALIAILAMVAVNLDFLPDAAWSMLSYENEAAAMVQILPL